MLPSLCISWQLIGTEMYLTAAVITTDVITFVYLFSMSSGSFRHIGGGT